MKEEHQLVLLGKPLNVGVGASVNTMTVDVLSLLLLRPVSAFLGAKLLGAMLT
jgi:hypothetical protein